jgi:hypothetical protein
MKRHNKVENGALGSYLLVKVFRPMSIDPLHFNCELY